MKKLLLLMLWSATLFAIPAKQTPTVVAQPDGTTFSIVGFGDERYNYAETLDGYVVLQGSDAYWYYATLSPEGRFVQSAFKVQGSSKLPQNQTMMSIPRHLVESQQVIADKMQTHQVERNINENTLFTEYSGVEANSGYGKACPHPVRGVLGYSCDANKCEFSRYGKR